MIGILILLARPVFSSASASYIIPAEEINASIVSSYSPNFEMFGEVRGYDMQLTHSSAYGMREGF
ncbi:MAG TPA: hypothetical protein VMD02_02630, partial [Candidatus Omnitrophota bacterium]|nr:hypothetical protein [Candidatus Omnitrophota bacterium]